MLFMLSDSNNSGIKPGALHLVNRQFRAEGLNRLWVTDITQRRTGEGWVYAAVVLDVFSRRAVGWSIADHLRTELVADAPDMARLCVDALRYVLVAVIRLAIVSSSLLPFLTFGIAANLAVSQLAVPAIPSLALWLAVAFTLRTIPAAKDALVSQVNEQGKPGGALVR